MWGLIEIWSLRKDQFYAYLCKNTSHYNKCSLLFSKKCWLVRTIHVAYLKASYWTKFPWREFDHHVSELQSLWNFHACYGGCFVLAPFWIGPNPSSAIGLMRCCNYLELIYRKSSLLDLMIVLMTLAVKRNYCLPSQWFIHSWQQRIFWLTQFLNSFWASFRLWGRLPSITLLAGGSHCFHSIWWYIV